MAWVSKDDVRGAAHGHFLFSLLLMVFFGVGYHHTRATDFGGAVPYWVFGAVGGGVHFLCMISGSHAYNKRGSDNEFLKAIGLYHFVASVLIFWSIGGCVATGSIGTCANLETCQYQEHQGVNKAMAICITVFHALSFFFACHQSGESKRFKLGGGVTQVPAPATNTQSIARAYNPPATAPYPTAAEPPPYSEAIKSPYSIPPPQSDNLSPPPPYEIYMAGSHPTSNHEPFAPAVV